MRVLEILVVLAAAAALLAAVFPLPHRLRLLAAPAAALAVGIHLLAEGPRAPMVPAYALVGLLFLAWLRTVARGRPVRRRATRFTALGVGVAGMAAAVALPVAVPAYTFPRPGGPYAIGTLTYHWTDTDRPEILSADPDDHRELMVQIWYPAETVPTAHSAPYVPDADAVGSAMAGLHGLPEVLFNVLGSATTNAVTAAPAATDRPTHPVLIFLEGLTGYRQMNTFQVEELVSRGYVVAAIDQPSIAADVVFPDGRRAGNLTVAEMKALLAASLGPVATPPTLNGRSFADGDVGYLAQDVGFTLDQLAVLNRADPNGVLTGRLDLERTGLFGISMGGIVGAEACRLDPRLRACLVMDAPMPSDVVRDGLAQPTMWITRDVATMQAEGWSPAEIDQHQTTMRSTFDTLRADGWFVQIPGMFHLDLTDIPALLPITRLLGYAGPIGTRHAHDLVNAYSTAFFDRYLAGRPAPLLDEPPDLHPDVQVESHRP